MRTSFLAMGLLAILAGAAAQDNVEEVTTTDVVTTTDDDIPNTSTYGEISLPVDPIYADDDAAAEVEPEVDPEVTDGAAGAWGSKSGAMWGGAVAVSALGAAALGLV